MKHLIKTIAVVFTVLLFAGPASAGMIFNVTNEVPDQTFGSTTIDGAFIVADGGWVGPLSLAGSFSGWGDLGGYQNLAATLTFTWHDDDNLNYSGSTALGSDFNNWDTESGGPGPYPDLAMVTLDGTKIFENVSVGVFGGTGTSVYTYSPTDLGMLDDGALDYLIEAGKNGSARTDFVVDSVALAIEGTSAVPVPGAVWLLSTGLLALAGIQRRRR